MASDLPRVRRRFGSALLTGVLACSLTWPAHATVAFAAPPDESAPDPAAELPPLEPELSEPELSEPELSEPELSEPELSEPEPSEPELSEPELSEPEPSEPEPSEPAPPAPEPTSTVTVGSSTDYEAFADSLPDDFDINYKFVRAPDPKKDKPASTMTDQQRKALRSSGGAIMGLGLVGGAVMLGVGGFQVAKAKGDLSDLDGMLVSATDRLEQQQGIIEKGKLGNTLLIAGGATAGGAFALGLSLLLAGRKKGSSDGRDRPVNPKLGTSSQKGLSLGLMGGGALFLGIGLVLDLTSDSEDEKGPITALYVGGGAFVGVGALFGVLYLVGKRQQQRIARVQLAPILTRTTTGASLRLRF